MKLRGKITSQKLMISDNASSNKGVSKEVVIDLWQFVGQSRGFNKQIMVTYDQNSLKKNKYLCPC